MALSIASMQRLRCRIFLVLVGNLLILSALCSSHNGRRRTFSISSSSLLSISASSSQSLFGVRGGAGFFGFGNNKRSQTNGNGGDGDDDDNNRNNSKNNSSKQPKFPALSRDEIEEKLNIPIFGITDSNGNGVILSDKDGNNIFHFFFSQHMADAALTAICNANVGAPELKVSSFHLGKCWFRLIDHSGGKEFKLQKLGKDQKMGEEVTKPVNFRLVPNMRDLLGARVLTGLQPGDVQQLKDAVEAPNAQKAISIIQKASSESNSFTNPFGQIPVFAIAQMRIRKKDEDGNPIGEPMLPMHFSTKTMSDTWNEFVHHSPQFSDAEATLQLVELHKMIEMMQADSDFDFRHVVFMVPSYDKDGQNNNNDISEDEDDSDDDDNGGGGDNGMKADIKNYDEISIEPFVSMEIFADSPGQTLVQL